VGDPRGQVPAFVTEAIARHAHQFGEYPAINGTRIGARRPLMAGSQAFRLPDADRSRHASAAAERHARGAVPGAVHRDAGKESRRAARDPDPQSVLSMLRGRGAGGGAEAVFVPAHAETEFPAGLRFASGVEMLERTAAVYHLLALQSRRRLRRRAYWRTLFALADRYDFTVFADECYADIYFDKPPLSALTARYAQTRRASRLLTFHSLSKRSGLPGLRSGIVAGDPKLIAKFRALRITPARRCPCRSWRRRRRRGATKPMSRPIARPMPNACAGRALSGQSRAFRCPMAAFSCGSMSAMARRRP
jgi:N-succinyldiaminopimelate aminotransferase